MINEICVESLEEALKGQEKGANRIEFCDNLAQDGTTPSYGNLKVAKESLSVNIMAIIRPRGGNFEYSKLEKQIMLEDIKKCKELSIYGVVIGALKGKEIDYQMVKELVDCAKPMSITFHMAFDEIENKEKAIDFLIKIGVDRILTKGGSISAYENISELKRLNEYAKNRIIIMPGKGINLKNKNEIIEKTGCKEIHGSKIV
ncbi:MAG: copper homeostasis protein CutC [Sarcina sp.]